MAGTYVTAVAQAGRSRTEESARDIEPEKGAIVTRPTKSQKATEELVAGFMDRLGEQDAEGIGKLFADEIDWYVPGSEALPWTGSRSRREHVAEYFGAMWPAFVPGESTATVDKVVIDGDDAVIFSSFSHTVARNGKRLHTPAAMHLTIANGQIVRMHLYEDTLAVREALKD
jgi:ketosteroid isomerase-like protein